MTQGGTNQDDARAEGAAEGQVEGHDAPAVQPAGEQGKGPIKRTLNKKLAVGEVDFDGSNALVYVSEQMFPNVRGALIHACILFLHITCRVNFNNITYS